jgi:hypothetical protein
VRARYQVTVPTEGLARDDALEELTRYAQRVMAALTGRAGELGQQIDGVAVTVGLDDWTLEVALVIDADSLKEGRHHGLACMHRALQSAGPIEGSHAVQLRLEAEEAPDGRSTRQLPEQRGPDD